MQEIFAEIITIGDEILYGQIVDTNSQWISAELDKIGIKTRRKITVGDNESEILACLSEAETRSDIILITGGLGPTRDDITKISLAKYFNVDLLINEEALLDVVNFFKKFGRELTETNRRQAELPSNCQVISNKRGTAPGMWFFEGKKVFVSMPGVPHEMKAMMTKDIIPRLQQQFQTPVILHKIVKTAGIGESYLSDLASEWEADLPDSIKLAYLPGFGQVKMRLTCMGLDKDQAEKLLENEIEKLKKIAHKYIYGYDNDELEKVVGDILRRKKLKLATAESCTGGYLAKTITSIPGSSDYFQGGIIPYHNLFKQELLNVSEDTLIKKGAVSEETVIQMAENVKSLFTADIGLSTSGIAGPDGGTEEKPVGTVWVGISGPWGTHAKKFTFGGDRMANIHFTTLSILYLLWQRLIEID